MRRALSYLAVFALGIAVALLAVHLLSPGDDEAGVGAASRGARGTRASAEPGQRSGKTTRLTLLHPSTEVSWPIRHAGAVGEAESPDAGDESDAGPPEAPSEPAPSASAAKPAAPDAGEAHFTVNWTPPSDPRMTTTGTIRGHVIWRGPAPKKTIEVDRDREVCGSEVADDSLVVTDGKLADAFVSLNYSRDEEAPAPTRQVAVESRGCRFLPRVQLAPGATKVVLTNNDSRIRDIDLYRGIYHEQTRLLPSQGGALELPLSSGLNEIRDSVYPWMHAFIDTTQSKRLVLTGTDGAFEFKNVDMRAVDELIVRHHAPDLKQVVPFERQMRRGGTYEVEVFLP